MRKADAVLGLAALVAGGVVVRLSVALPNLPRSYAGPGLFPTLIGGGLMLAGFLLLLPGVRAWRAGTAGSRPSRPAEPSNNAPGPDAISWRGLVEVVTAVVVFILLAPRLGFVVGAFIMLAGLLLARGNRLATALVVALGMTLIVRWMFVILLKVPLPMGPWGW